MRLAKFFGLVGTAILVSTSLSAEPGAEPARSSKSTADKPTADKPTTDGQNLTATAKPDVATLLFGNPQWGTAPPGTTLDYGYSKKTTKPAFGPPFDDRIVLKLDKGDDPESRTAQVKMFSGTNAKPAGPFQSDKQNPVLLLVMEENVQELSKIFKANPRYLKNAIRKAWRETPQIANTQIDVGGKSVPGTKITVAPFMNDAEKDKMMGLESITYTVEIADSVPGNIARIDIRAPADGKPIFSETLRYQGDSK